MMRKHNYWNFKRWRNCSKISQFYRAWKCKKIV